jgi:uncharacterized protein YeeX (DUF496 family)
MWSELPRVKFEKGIITGDVFERDNPNPVYHIKGHIKDKDVRSKIATIKERYGSAFFSDILDFVEISRSVKDIKKELKEIQKYG